MRARMRSPRRIVSRCSGEYVGDPRFAVARRLVGGFSPLAGQGGGKEQPGIGHQAAVVEGDTDAVGVVAW